MLRYRVITALLLAPLAIGAMYALPLDWFALVFGLVAALGAYEWSGLAHWVKPGQRATYMAVFAMLAAASYFAGAQAWALWLGAGLWIFAGLAIFTYPATRALLGNPLVVGLLGVAIILSAWSALIVIRQAPGGSHWLLWMFVLVWGADVGAYFAGRQFGQRKLAPTISPAKTWEGVAGGALLALVVCGAALAVVGVLDVRWAAALAGLIALAVIGDLFESLLKRASGVKDSGTLLPGHGGVLDRIDSVLAVAPIFALVLTYL